MTSESISVNGSNDPDVDEKILKPRKSILNEKNEAATQNGNSENGNSENGTISENGDTTNAENGHDVESESGDSEANKPSKRTLRQKNMPAKTVKESTPTKRELRQREPTPTPAKTVKESTPTKRELRQREPTPRRSTPKPETPSKLEVKPKETPSKVDTFENNSEPKDKNEDESVIIIDDSNVITIGDSGVETPDKEKPQEKSFFSVFHRMSSSSSEMKESCEANSTSVIYVDSPSISESKVVPSKDIKGRKPINSFSRFPGRNISIDSNDRSLKRKAEESFVEEDRKRFAGEAASGSEKSPGWSFFSPSLRAWSPPRASKTSLPTSTPFHKKDEEQDSMAVNYDSKTKLDLDESTEGNTSKSKSRNWCQIM